MGKYEVPKCWDIALVSMHAGEKFKIKCPAHYAYGGEEKYSHFGSSKIPSNSNLIFDIELLNCATSFTELDEANSLDGNDAAPLS